MRGAGGKFVGANPITKALAALLRGVCTPADPILLIYCLTGGGEEKWEEIQQSMPFTILSLRVLPFLSQYTSGLFY